MSALLVIFIITAVVAVLFGFFYLLKLLADGRKLRQEAREWQQRLAADEARARLAGDQLDGTKFYDTDYQPPEILK